MDKVVHFEVPFDDQARAKKFYGDVFGWEMVDVPGMSYTIVRTVAVDENNMPKEAGAINGGLTPRDETAATPVVVVDVASVDQAVKKAEVAGGSVIMPKHAVGDMGLYARVKDTEGNIIGLWENIKK
jgi:uncharacterized protein